MAAFAIAAVRSALLLEEVAGEVELAVSVAARCGGAVDSHGAVDGDAVR